MKVNYRQISILVFMSFISLKLLALPSLLFLDSKNMSWLVCLVLMLLDGAYVFLLLDLIKKSGNRNIIEFMKDCLGPVLSRIFLACFIVKYALVIANISKGLEFFVVENFYAEFNWFVFVIPLTMLVGFMAYKGVRNIARVSELVCWAIVIGCLYIAFKSFSGVDMLSFLPMFEDGVKPLAYSAYHHLSWFGSASFLFMLFGKVDFRQEKKITIIKYIFFAIALVQLLMFVFYGLFNITSASHNFCISDISQYYNNMSSISELSWLVVSLWVVAQAVQLALYTFCMMEAIKFLFNIKNDYFPTVIVMVYIVLLSYIGEQTIGLERIFFSHVASITTIVVQYILPIILWLGYKIKNIKKKNIKVADNEKVKVNI